MKTTELLTNNHYGTIDGSIQLTKKSQEVYCVFETWHENTSRGGYGHQNVPCNITVHSDLDEARNKMAELVDKHDVNCNFHTKSNQEPYQIIEVWEDEDECISLGDCTIHLVTVDDLFENFDTESKDNMGYNGVDENVVFDLKMEETVVIDE